MLNLKIISFTISILLILATLGFLVSTLFIIGCMFSVAMFKLSETYQNLRLFALAYSETLIKIQKFIGKYI